MDAELQKAIADILVIVKDSAQYAAVAAKGELPLLVKEYLSWGLVSNGICAFFIFVPIVYWRIMRKLPYGPMDNYSDGFSTVMFGLLGGVASIVLFVIGFSSLMDAIQVLVAPRVYLLERLSALLK